MKRDVRSVASVTRPKRLTVVPVQVTHHRQCTGAEDETAPQKGLVRVLRWIDAGIRRLLEWVGQTEHQMGTTQIAVNQIIQKRAAI